jgi:hypothetical protein
LLLSRGAEPLGLDIAADVGIGYIMIIDTIINNIVRDVMLFLNGFHFYISRVHTKTRVLEYKHYLYLLDKVGVMSKDPNIKIGSYKV